MRRRGRMRPAVVAVADHSQRRRNTQIAVAGARRARVELPDGRDVAVKERVDSSVRGCGRGFCGGKGRCVFRRSAVLRFDRRCRTKRDGVCLRNEMAQVGEGLGHGGAEERTPGHARSGAGRCHERGSAREWTVRREATARFSDQHLEDVVDHIAGTTATFGEVVFVQKAKRFA